MNLIADAGGTAAIVARALDFTALVAAFGACVFRIGVVRGAAPGDAARNAVVARMAAMAGLGAAMLALVATSARIAIQAMAFAMPGEPLAPTLQLVLRTDWGVTSLVQGVWAILAIVAFTGAATTRGGTWRGVTWWAVATVASGFAALSLTFSGHAAAHEERFVVATLADAAHVIAAGGWAGAVGVLAWVAWRWRGDPDAAGVTATLIDRFKPVALTSAAVLVASGVVSAWLNLGGIAPLFSSTYGRLLLAKVAIVIVVAELGRRHSLTAARDVRAGRTAAVARSIVAEAALMVVVLAVTALLAGSPLPGE